MKQIIYVLVCLLLVGNVIAYGGGFGTILPPLLSKNLQENKNANVPHDTWFPFMLQEGELHWHTLFDDDIPLTDMKIVTNKDVRGPNFFVVMLELNITFFYLSRHPFCPPSNKYLKQGYIIKPVNYNHLQICVQCIIVYQIPLSIYSRFQISHCRHQENNKHKV